MDFLTCPGSCRRRCGHYLGQPLRDQERIVHTLTVSKFSTECVFKSLVSGRLYNISISTRSGEYENHTAVQERTRKHIH
ncbi:hypothetical protein QQF64_006608 [Cirrhinus molitorella]|uniref:Uncharacterized protein n=1 Tax=Cirrhinus molitorella TaxID=172907 RepID=A0ABR3M8A9_9TELE